MLVLLRRVGDTIVLNHEKPGEIKIRLNDILSETEATIGIEAPQSVTIDRGEYLRKKFNRKELPDFLKKKNKQGVKTQGETREIRKKG